MKLWLVLVLVGFVCANDVPSFPFFSWDSGKAGEVNFALASNPGKLSIVGVSNQASATFPEAVVVCLIDEVEANTIACNQYSCTSVASCKEEAIASIDVVFYPMPTITMIGSFPNYSSVLWIEIPIPDILNETTVTNQTWFTYTFTPSALALQNSDFEYIVSIGKDDPTNVYVKMEAGKQSFSAVGFRAKADADFPTYVIMCPSVLEKCVDAKCTDASNCTLITPIGISTDYHKNTNKYTIVTRQTDVPVKADTVLYLASLRKEAAAPLNIDVIQNQKWKCQIGLPRSNATRAVPSLLALVALLIIIKN